MAGSKYMTDEQRAQLMGDELTRSMDALTAFCWPGSDRAPEVVGDFIAAVLGRVTALAASKVVEQHHLVERVDALEERVAGGP